MARRMKTTDKQNASRSARRLAAERARRLDELLDRRRAAVFAGQLGSA